MGDLILVKHAAPEIVQRLSPARWELSPTGRRQSLELAGRLTRHSPGSLFSSDERKAKETAEIVGSQLHLSSTVFPGLQENDRSGMPFYSTEDQFRERIREFFERPDELVLGNESADGAHARFANAVAQLPTGDDARATVVVTHGAVLTLLVTRANGLEPFSFWSNLAFASFAVLSTPSLTLRHVDSLP